MKGSENSLAQRRYVEMQRLSVCLYIICISIFVCYTKARSRLITLILITTVPTAENHSFPINAYSITNSLNKKLHFLVNVLMTFHWPRASDCKGSFIQLCTHSNGVNKTSY